MKKNNFDIKPKQDNQKMEELYNRNIDMTNSENNIDFSKLTNEQLDRIMEQLQAQKMENEKRESEKAIQNNEQPQLDPMTQTLEEIRQKDAEQKAVFREQEQKFEKMLTGRDIVYYPKIDVSLD